MPSDNLHAQEAQAARLSASEVACYRWPEDTAEHRAMRAAFCDGAAHTVTAESTEAWAVLMDDQFFSLWLTETSARSVLASYQKGSKAKWDVISLRLTR